MAKTSPIWAWLLNTFTLFVGITMFSQVTFANTATDKLLAKIIDVSTPVSIKLMAASNYVQYTGNFQKMKYVIDALDESINAKIQDPLADYQDINSALVKGLVTDAIPQLFEQLKALIPTQPYYAEIFSSNLHTIFEINRLRADKNKKHETEMFVADLFEYAKSRHTDTAFNIQLFENLTRLNPKTFPNQNLVMGYTLSQLNGNDQMIIDSAARFYSKIIPFHPDIVVSVLKGSYFNKDRRDGLRGITLSILRLQHVAPELDGNSQIKQSILNLTQDETVGLEVRNRAIEALRSMELRNEYKKLEDISQEPAVMEITVKAEKLPWYKRLGYSLKDLVTSKISGFCKLDFANLAKAVKK